MKTKLKKLKTKIIKKETRNKFNERENSNKQIEEEKEVKSQQEIVQPKYLTIRKGRCQGIKLIFYCAA